MTRTQVTVFLLMMLVTLISIGADAKDIDCDRHSIYCQIKSNHKKLDAKYAMKLSNLIYKATKKHHIPPRVFTAILMQESRYSLKAKGCHKGLTAVPETGFVGPTDGSYFREVKVCSDFGIGQIYFKTARGFKFDIKKLTNDLEYSINSAALVLADFKKRYERRETHWWTRYNARSKTKRQIYRQLVSRYL